MQTASPTSLADENQLRAEALFAESFTENARRTDRMFAILMGLQWLAGIGAALWISPYAWEGGESYIHPHVWLALFLGGALASLPIYLATFHCGAAITRHVIALSQVLFSSLLIHLSGGRLETHFHVFGSLAFLAFYRDWTLLVPATLVVAVDHFVRGVLWPETVFGIATAAPCAWVEHAAWVIYEDVFLIMSCLNGVQEMRAQAQRTAELEHTNREVQERTIELESAYRSKDAIVETALDAVIGLDAEGRVNAWNTRAEEMFDRTAASAIGADFVATIVATQSAGDAERLRECLTSVAETAASRRIEVLARRNDGDAFPVELAIAPIRSGDAVNFCAFVRDITIQQETASSLRKAKESAEMASHAKSAFLANMSHEIRTPLNAILGFTHLLKENLDGDQEERRGHLLTIHDSGRHLLTLINDVLDLSKIEAGQMEVELLPCSPHEIIAASISILRVRAQERGINLEYFWKSDMPETVRTDANRLRQVLMNLIGNAIKFTEIGSVQVAARLTGILSPHLIIDVIDTGIGIAPDAAAQIFEPFVQADNSITRRFGGSGLGLSISRRLARLLGGDLVVNSELGRGSIFSLSIPLGSLEGVRLLPGSTADIVRTHEKEEPSEPLMLPPCRILLVEDGATNRKLIKLVLERAGAKVTCAENGKEGVDAASDEEFDLIFMDMQMPIMDGCTATRTFARLGCQTPIFALTAHAMASDERACREAGCDGYLTKPIDPERLLRAAGKALLDRRPQASSVPVVAKKRETPIISRLPTDDTEFCEIIEEFVVHLDHKLETLSAALAADDFQTVGEIAHWIKGAAGTAGFDAFTQPAGAIERLAKRGPHPQIAPFMTTLNDLRARIQLPSAAK